MDPISVRLRTLMREQKLTLDEVASRAQIPLETIRNLLYNRSRDPRLNTVLAISKAFDMSVAAFLGIEDPAEEKLQKDFLRCSPSGQKLLKNIAAVEKAIADKTTYAYDPKTITCYCPSIGSLDGITRQSSYETKQTQTSCMEASFAVEMPNDDFSPTYFRKDILLFVKRFPHNGEHALFLYQNRILFRRFLDNFSAKSPEYVLEPIGSVGSKLVFERMDQCTALAACIGVDRARYHL